MHIALYGATGKSGSRILTELLSRSHQVTAIVRDPAKLAAQQDLTIVQGDVASASAIADKINGADAVLRTRKGWTGGDTFVASPSLTVVSFSRDGFATNLPAGTVTMPLRTSPVNANATKCVALNRIGRQVVQTPGTGSCT